MAAGSRAYRVHGLDCAEEVALLKRELGPTVGGAERLGFDLVRGRLLVPEGVAPEVVIRGVAAAGLEAEPWREEGDSAAHGARRMRARLTAISGAATAVGFALHAVAAGGAAAALGFGGATSPLPLGATLLYLVAVVAGGWFVAPKAVAAARRLRPDMNLLMTLAVVGAIALGELFEAATVAFLFALSLVLEAWSVGRARHAVEALLELAAPTVLALAPDGGERELAPGELAPGSLFRVRPGERIALDGVVESGVSEVDEAPITGESVAVVKAPGDELFAGTVNGRGALVARSTRAASETVLARILRRVEEARSRRSPSERWVERFAAVYTPTIFLAAFALALLSPPLAGVGWGEAVYRGLALLVIGCPCALVVATPVAVVASLAASARHGVLVKGGRFVEEPARLRAVAMDKTGTLTEGRPEVVEIVPLDGHDERELLERAAALERASAHPLGRAIVACAEERGLRPRAAESHELLPGRGARGTIDGRPYWLGSHRFLEESGQETPEVHARIEAMSHGGRTIVAIGNERHVCGLIALADRVRPEGRELVRALHAAGVGRVVMLTGDHAPTAEAVAAECGIDEVESELLPEEKLAAIERLAAEEEHVAMIGDGVNDAPALARATVGIAMGAAGSDAAIETADVALVADDLSRVPWLVVHARRTLGVVRANVAFALAVKAIFLVAAVAGHATLWAAIAADMGATFVVIANALRLLRG